MWTGVTWKTNHPLTSPAIDATVQVHHLLTRHHQEGTMARHHIGGCMCGKVRLEVSGPLREVIAFRCRECQRASSNHVTATAAQPGSLKIVEDVGLTWYCHDGALNRGFCRMCGSTLFFDHGPDHPPGIAAGAFDEDPGVRVSVHIYTDEAGPWYRNPELEEDRCDTDTWKQTSWHDLAWFD